jgi:catechol 2,3-dioxygenase-like lactoylglutathione lyase family enzyme
MIFGAHIIIYSKDADRDRAFFRDVLKYPAVDAGHGWLIFALPPAELAMHPAVDPRGSARAQNDENGAHELYFMCEDVNAFSAEMRAKQVACSAIDEQRWGSITRLTLPGGGTIGVYQPKHPTAVTRG